MGICWIYPGKYSFPLPVESMISKACARFCKIQSQVVTYSDITWLCVELGEIQFFTLSAQAFSINLFLFLKRSWHTQRTQFSPSCKCPWFLKCSSM